MRGKTNEQSSEKTMKMPGDNAEPDLVAGREREQHGCGTYQGVRACCVSLDLRYD